MIANNRDNHADFELMARYEGRIERSYYKALDALAKLKKTRPTGANGFVSQNGPKQPEQTPEEIAPPPEVQRAATASTPLENEIGFVCPENAKTPVQLSESRAAQGASEQGSSEQPKLGQPSRAA